MAEIRFENSNRDTVCRICGHTIPKKTDCLAIRPLDIGGYYGPAFFHEDCVEKEITKAHELRR